MSPTRAYLICSMPRSGSSLLAESLAATGRLGTPLEYLDRTATFAELSARWGTADVAGYLRRLHRERTGAGGVFGCKVHSFHVTELTRALTAGGAVSGTWCERRAAALELLAPGARHVLVTRRDVDRQAVSWFVAERTGRWSTADERGRGSGDVAYDPRGIERCRRLVVAGERAWRRDLAAIGAPVLELVYEDLVTDRAATVRAVAAHVGVSVGDVRLPPPRLRRQADARSEALLARYRSGERRRRPFGAGGAGR